MAALDMPTESSEPAAPLSGKAEEAELAEASRSMDERVDGLLSSLALLASIEALLKSDGVASTPPSVEGVDCSLMLVGVVLGHVSRLLAALSISSGASLLLLCVALLQEAAQKAPPHLPPPDPGLRRLLAGLLVLGPVTMALGDRLLVAMAPECRLVASVIRK